MSLTSYQAAPPCNKGRRNVRLRFIPVKRLKFLARLGSHLASYPCAWATTPVIAFDVLRPGFIAAAMKPAARAMLVLAVALLLSAAGRAQVIFGSVYNGPGSQSTLYTIDPSTGAGTAVGAIGF